MADAFASAESVHTALTSKALYEWEYSKQLLYAPLCGDVLQVGTMRELASAVDELLSP